MLPLNRESLYFSATFAVKIKETDRFTTSLWLHSPFMRKCGINFIGRTQTSAPAASPRDRLFCETIPLLNPEMAGSSQEHRWTDETHRTGNIIIRGEAMFI